MKRLFYVIIDLALIFAGIQLSFAVLDSLGTLQEYQRNFDAFQIIVPYICVFYVIFMYGFGLYNINRKPLSDIIFSVFLLSVALTVAIMGICFFIRDVALGFPRSVILLSGVLYLFALVLWRSLCWMYERRMEGMKKVAVFSANERNLSDAVEKKLSKYYSIEYDGNGQQGSDSIEQIITEADEIFIGSDIKPEIREKALLLSIKYRKSVFFVPEYYDLSLMAASMQKTDDIPTFFISSMGHSPEEEILKRIFDIILSAFFLILLAPFALIIIALIKTDGGPAFYFQERVTRNNRVFKMLKFRTMIPDAEKISGPTLAGDDDPRITRIGRFLRAIRMDEIPQLWNILKGDMSIVGPRPERPFFVDQFVKDIPEYDYRHRVKAGLTGLAQVEGKYNTSVENKLRYDLIYINSYSLWRDLLILVRTVKILFSRESTEGVKKK
jgi:exopolysaccharide biosynthesis polyprenyl glycosylphosphotransferase